MLLLCMQLWHHSRELGFQEPRTWIVSFFLRLTAELWLLNSTTTNCWLPHWARIYGDRVLRCLVRWVLPRIFVNEVFFFISCPLELGHCSTSDRFGA